MVARVAAAMRPPSPPLPPDPTETTVCTSPIEAHQPSPLSTESSLSPGTRRSSNSVYNPPELSPPIGSAPAFETPSPTQVQAAVNTAADQSKPIHALDPDLIRQVTEQVIQSLTNANFGILPTSAAAAAAAAAVASSPLPNPALQQSTSFQFPPSPVLSSPETLSQGAGSPPFLRQQHRRDESHDNNPLRVASPKFPPLEDERSEKTLKSNDAPKVDNSTSISNDSSNGNGYGSVPSTTHRLRRNTGTIRPSPTNSEEGLPIRRDSRAGSRTRETTWNVGERPGSRYGYATATSTVVDGPSVASEDVTFRRRDSPAGSRNREPSWSAKDRPDAPSGNSVTGDGRSTVVEDAPPRRRESRAASRTRDATRSHRDSVDSANGLKISMDGPRRQSTLASDEEETTLERAWRPLFDNGVPTTRMSQFLRGIALHLIDDYEPKGSLVVTPAKVMRFLSETAIENELYPWDIIFGGKLTHLSLSTIYRRLLCQHHLIQIQNREVPVVPGLTPQGFDSFMTCLIQAHPDAEFQRLSKAVMNMPISNADKKNERFPKELSRRLFPAQANVQAQQRLLSSLQHEPYVLGEVKSSSAMPPPPQLPPQSQHSSFTEREHQPPPVRQTQASSDNGDNESSAVFERERKPYFAKEGSGKVYSSNAKSSTGPPPPTNANSHPNDDHRPPPSKQYRNEPPQSHTNTSRPARTMSAAPPRPAYSSTGSSEPINIPARSHRMSTSQAPPPLTSSFSGYSAPRRSPPPRSFGRSSEPADVGGGGNSQTQFGSNLHKTVSANAANNLPREQPFFEADDDPVNHNSNGNRRRYTNRGPPLPRNSQSSSWDEGVDSNNNSSSRVRSIPNRSMPPASNNYDYSNSSRPPPPLSTSTGSTGSNGMSGPPLGNSYPYRNNSISNNNNNNPPNVPINPNAANNGIASSPIDVRRRSTNSYNPSIKSNEPGGTDGWGSFASNPPSATAYHAPPLPGPPPPPPISSQQQQGSQWGGSVGGH